MKRLFIMILLLAGGKTIAYGQTEQGNMVVSGGVGGSISSDNFKNSYNPDGLTRKSSSASFSPTFGYFVQDGLEIGLGPNVYFYKNKNHEGNVETIYHIRSFGFSPYIRKYFVLSDKLMAHGTGTASANFRTSWTENASVDSPEKYKSIYLAVFIYPGVTYFATEKLGITATIGNLGYGRNMPKRRDGESKIVGQNFIADVSLSSLTLGINYFIAR